MNIKSVAIELSNQCNLFCPMCNRATKGIPKHKQYISPEQFENLKLDRIPSVNKLEITGMIGDPLTNPNITDICSIAKGWNVRTNISTNGCFYDEDWWYKFPKYLPKQHDVIFALDGADNEVLNMYRRGSNFDRVIRNIKAFVAGGGRAAWQYILFSHNMHQIDLAKSISKECGSRFFIMPSSRYNNEFKKPTLHIKSDNEYSKEQNVKCRLQFGNINITSKGEYTPCCFVLNTIDIIKVSMQPVMTLDNITLPELIDNRFYDSILKRVLSKNIKICQHCTAHCGVRYCMNENTEEILKKFS